MKRHSRVFSLRALLFIVACVCGGTAWLLSPHLKKQSRNRASARVVRAVTDCGGAAEFAKPVNDKWHFQRVRPCTKGVSLATLLRDIKAAGGTVRLDLSNSVVDDNAITSIANVPIRSLDVSNTNVTDRSLSSIARASGLSSLNLSETDISDQGIQFLSSLSSSMTSLSMSGTRISDESIRGISTFGRLERLRLNGTQITDNCVGDLAKLKSLKYLDVSDTAITLDGYQKITANHPDADVRY